MKSDSRIPGIVLILLAGLSVTQAVNAETCPDADLDGYVDRFHQTCTIPAGKSAGDCDDADAAVHPGAPDTCNQRDDDCDGAIDEGHPHHYKSSLGEIGERLGHAVAGIGDVDGDGLEDFVAGADEYPQGAGNRGRIAVFSGADGSLLCQVAGRGNDQLGNSVAALGDVTGDGRPEFLAGAPKHDAVPPPGPDPVIDSGAVRVFSYVPGSGACELVLEIDWGVDTDYRLGKSVAGLGDVDRDGWPDLAAGAPRADPGVTGAVLLFSGRTGALIGAFVDPEGLMNDQLGTALSGLGDIDGDEVPDVVVGAHNAFSEQQGLALVFSGATGDVIHRLRQPNPAIGQHFGQSVGRLGDLDDDGADEILVGAPDADGRSEGLVFVYSGGSGDLMCIGKDFYANGGEDLGASVTGLPDITGDEVPDFAAGAPNTPIASGPVQAGAVLLFSGATCAAAGGAEILAFQKLLDPEAGQSDHLGRSMSFLHDVNGDGLAEVLVGSPTDDVPLGAASLADAGSVSVLSVQADCDGDGRVPARGDCRDDDTDVWGVPGDVAGVRFAVDGAIEWDEIVDPGGSSAGSVALGYDVIRSIDSADFQGAAMCLESDDTDLWAADVESPTAGQIFHYLVRARNLCGLGSVGRDSAGVERSARECP